MIVNDPELAFLSFYILEREFFLQSYIREGINTIAYLIYKQKVDKALAIDIVSKKIKKEYNTQITKEYLWKVYRQRTAYIKNGKEAFKKYKIHKYNETIPEKWKTKPKLCECGCGNPVKPGNRFIHGHHVRCRSKKEKEINAKRMREGKLKKNKYLKLVNSSNSF